MRIDQAGRSHLPETTVLALILGGEIPRIETVEGGFSYSRKSRQNVTGYNIIIYKMALYQEIEKRGLK